jgi:hypothetical protein
MTGRVPVWLKYIRKKERKKERYFVNYDTEP